MKSHKPADASAIIELELELDKIQLRGARDFYNDVICVLDKYNVVKEDKDLCMLLGKKNSNGAHAKVILDELKKAQPDFDQLCTDVSEIQCLTRAGGGKGRSKKEGQEVQLASADNVMGGKFKWNLQNLRCEVWVELQGM